MSKAASHAEIETPDRQNREIYTISDLSDEFGVTARALRFYEDEGLIAPHRKGLSRIYTKRDRARLAWIVRAKNVGFSLSEIKELIDLYDLGDGRQTQMEVTIKKVPGKGRYAEEAAKGHRQFDQGTDRFHKDCAGSASTAKIEDSADMVRQISFSRK